MKIVALDTAAADFDGLDWGGFAEAGELVCHPNTTPEETLSRCEGATAVLVNKAVLTAETLSALPELRYVGITATGTGCYSAPPRTWRSSIVRGIWPMHS